MDPAFGPSIPSQGRLYSLGAFPLPLGLDRIGSIHQSVHP